MISKQWYAKTNHIVWVREWIISCWKLKKLEEIIWQSKPLNYKFRIIFKCKRNCEKLIKSFFLTKKEVDQELKSENWGKLREKKLRETIRVSPRVIIIYGHHQSKIVPTIFINTTWKMKQQKGKIDFRHVLLIYNILNSYFVRVNF
jgi:hypothetical protein